MIAHLFLSKIPYIAGVFPPVTLGYLNPTEIIADSFSVLGCDVGRGTLIFTLIHKAALKYVVNAKGGAYNTSVDAPGTDLFSSTFLQRYRSVDRSLIQELPDANRWFLYYETPVVAGNQKRAILQYEPDLDILQRAQTKVSSGMNCV